MLSAPRNGKRRRFTTYNAVEVERSTAFDAGVTSRDAYDQAQQTYQNAKADYESAIELRKTQEQLLAYYKIQRVEALWAIFRST